MAAASCRAIFVVRWCEMSRVLTATTRRCRKETWCRRWWHISQRSVSLSASSYSPKLNPLLMKQLKEPKATEKEVKKTARVTSAEKEIESVGIQHRRVEIANLTEKNRTDNTGDRRSKSKLPVYLWNTQRTARVSHRTDLFYPYLNKKHRSLDPQRFVSLDAADENNDYAISRNPDTMNKVHHHDELNSLKLGSRLGKVISEM